MISLRSAIDHARMCRVVHLLCSTARTGPPPVDDATGRPAHGTLALAQKKKYTMCMCSVVSTLHMSTNACMHACAFFCVWILITCGRSCTRARVARTHGQIKGLPRLGVRNGSGQPTDDRTCSGMTVPALHVCDAMHRRKGGQCNKSNSITEPNQQETQPWLTTTRPSATLCPRP